MKKIIFIVLTVSFILYISYDKNDEIIKENKVYSQQIEFSDESGYEVNVDKTVAIKKAKEFISSIYDENNFDNCRLDFSFSSDNTFFVYFYFNNNSNPKYFVSFDINKGEVKSINKQQGSDKTNYKGNYKSADELKDISMDYMKRLRTKDIEDYSIENYEYYFGVFSIKYRNSFTGEEICIILQPVTGELIEYNLYQIKNIG